ncbi:MAG: serine hydrolase [Ignavibacteriales bacterium]|nr:serine hydrolase [Ignavibacteriales bacterium]
MKMRTLLLSFPLFLLLLCSSCKEKSVDSGESSTALDEAFSLASQNPNLKCLIVYKDSRIMKEQYFHPGDSLSPHDVRSVTKSVMATLIGIAIDKGYVPSEDYTIGSYLQPFVGSIDSAKANIKISDVLSMSAGFAGNELANVSEYNSWVSAPDQLAYTLNKSMIRGHGQVFNYDSGVAHLASAILTQAAGISTVAFAKQYLFQPLGIADPGWETDKREMANGAAGLNLTPYDMLKIGQLYLNKGMYNGIRIVSEDWIAKASSFKIATNNAQPFTSGYGYFWWTGNIHSHNYFLANGYGGQFIVVVPDIRLIVVATNIWRGVSGSTANEQWYTTLDIIMNRIIVLY